MKIIKLGKRREQKKAMVNFYKGVAEDMDKQDYADKLRLVPSEDGRSVTFIFKRNGAEIAKAVVGFGEFMEHTAASVGVLKTCTDRIERLIKD